MRIERRMLAWLLSCGLLPVMTTAVLSPSLAGLSEEFQSEAQVSVLAKLVLTSPALAIALGAGFVGVLLDRLGRLPILTLSLFGFAAFGCYGYWAEGLQEIILARFFFGFCVAGIMTTTATLLADLSATQDLRRVLGLQAALMGVWGITAQTFAGWMAEWHWRGPFLLYTISLPLLLWFFTLQSGVLRSAHHQEEAEVEAEVYSTRLTIAVLILLSVAAMSLFSLVPVHGPLYFKQILHRGPRGTAFLISSLTAASSLSSLTLAVWRRHLKTSHLLLMGFAAISLSCALMGFTPMFWVVWIGMLCMGVGIGLVIPCLQTSLIQRVSSKGRGRALGIFTSANYIGQFLCPFWAQFFLLQGGHLSLFRACAWIGACLTLGVAILMSLHIFAEEAASGEAQAEIQAHPNDASDRDSDKRSS